MAPFSDPAATFILVVLALFCAATGLWVLKTKSLNAVVEVVLLVFSGLLGKSFNIRSNPRFAVWYAIWLCLIGFISMTYTNILQSIVVVPGVRNDGTTFEELIARNFTFLSEEVRWIREFTKHHDIVDDTDRRSLTYKSTTSILEQEKTLARLLSHISLGNFTWSLLEEKNACAMLLRDDAVSKLVLVGNLVGWDVVAGQEQFFNIPDWWDFDGVESGMLLAKSVDKLKQFGVFSYFFNLFGKILDKIRIPLTGAHPGKMYGGCQPKLNFRFPAFF